MQEDYYLRGLINFIPPNDAQGTSVHQADLTKMGHYSTICYINGEWAEFDTKESKIQDQFTVIPELIMYSL